MCKMFTRINRLSPTGIQQRGRSGKAGEPKQKVTEVTSYARFFSPIAVVWEVIAQLDSCFPNVLAPMQSSVICFHPRIWLGDIWHTWWYPTPSLIVVSQLEVKACESWGRSPKVRGTWVLQSHVGKLPEHHTGSSHKQETLIFLTYWNFDVVYYSS